MALQIRCCVIAANGIWPKDEKALAMRAEFQNRALGYCAALADHFAFAVETLDPTDINGKPKDMPERLGKIAEEINREISLIKSWQASDKVRKSQKDP